MPRRVILTAVLVALPGVSLAVAGLFHPHHLTYDTSQRWYRLHLVGLVVFPLVGVSLAWLVRGRSDPTSWLVRLTAYGYATFYSALDILSGIGTGYLTHELGPGVPRSDAVRMLFHVGNPMGDVGAVCLQACTLVLVLDALVDVRRYAVGGLLLLPGAWWVHSDHIFSPLGALGMLLLGLGAAALVVGRSLAPVRRFPRARGATFGAPSAS